MPVCAGYALEIDAQDWNSSSYDYSMMSVAADSRVLGNVIRSAFAVLKFTRNSILVGSSTGRSPGLATFRILSTKTAARRHIAGWSAPYDMSAPASDVSLDHTDNGKRRAIARFAIYSLC